MSYLLFLDDERFPPVSWKGQVHTIARSYNEFVLTIKDLGCPTFISFDHDLGGEKTGLDCAKWFANWLLDNGGEPAAYTVHSMNPVGKKNIEDFMVAFHRHCASEDTGAARSLLS